MTAPLDVILAEDNIVQRTYLARMIQHLGYRIFEAEDGNQALELVRSTGAQILISDYQMPNLDGIELTRAVRELNLDHYVHIIMITGNEHSDVSAEALEAGADDFLPKGHDPARLRARMGTASRLIHHARELAEQHRILKERTTGSKRICAPPQRRSGNCCLTSTRKSKGFTSPRLLCRRRLFRGICLAALRCRTIGWGFMPWMWPDTGSTRPCCRLRSGI